MSKAARKQFLTVPSLVHRINTLEAELGYRVLERGQQGVTATPAGEKLYHAVKQALSILDAAKGEPGQADAGPQSVSVGVWWRIPPHFLDATDKLELPSRGIYLDYVSMDFNEAAEGFDRHVIDLYLSVRSRELDERGLPFTPLTSVRHCCVFSPSSRLAHLESVTAADLDGYTVYAGADYRNMPELAACPDVQKLFASDDVLKESIFVEKVIQDCAQDKAVAFFPQPRGASEINFASELSQLESRPMAWPIVSAGAYLAPGAPPEAARLVADVARICQGSPS